MKRLYVLLTILVIVIACKSKKAAVAPLNVADFIGNYTSSGYSERDMGSDYVVYSVSRVSDSVAHIRVRSRIDLKNPTCTFDCDATISSADTLRGSGDGRDLFFILRGDSLVVSAETERGLRVTHYFCDGENSLSGSFARLTEPLDTTHLDPIDLRKSEIYNNYMMMVMLTRDQAALVPYGVPESRDTIYHDMSSRRILATGSDDLNGDHYPEFLVYTVSKDDSQRGDVLVYSVIDGKKLQRIELPSMKNSDYAGHDTFNIHEGELIREYPVYQQGRLTRKIHIIKYKLIGNGEDSHFVEVDDFDQ